MNVHWQVSRTEMAGDFSDEDLRLIQHPLNSFQHNNGYHALIQKVEDLVEHSNIGYGPQLLTGFLGNRSTCLFLNTNNRG